MSFDQLSETHMFARRSMLALLVTLAGTASLQAQAVDLTETDAKDKSFRVELRMNLTGQITVRQGGKDILYKQSAQAQHDYLERLLETGSVGLFDKAARIYEKADAQITITPVGDVKNVDQSTRTLRRDRNFMIVQRQNDQVTAYSPEGTLFPEEAELTEHIDTLAISGLLPGKKVNVGETWKLSNAAAQALCDLDGLVSHDLVGKLEKIDGDRAQLSVTGTAQGIDLGAGAKLKVQATAAFDIKERCLVFMEWKQSDDRAQGPVSPALTADVVTTMKRTVIEQPKELHNFALVPKLAKTPITEISHVDAKGRYEFQCPRDWHLVGRTDNHLVLRLLERGDFLAQATVAPWKKTEPGKHMSAEEFKALMQQAPGWQQEKWLSKDDKAEMLNGVLPEYKIVRVQALGQHEGVDAVQYGYLVAGPQGEQTIVTFIMTPNQAPKLEGRDLTIVRSLTYPGAAAPSTPSVDATPQTKKE
jgi:hypothetical protein